jgi:peptide/nickel transport system substrate-binding protein
MLPGDLVGCLIIEFCGTITYMKEKIRIHPAIFDWQSELRQGKMSRREFLHLATLVGASVAAAQALAGCGPLASAPDASTVRPIKRGGTMKIGSAIQPIDHPARLSWIEGANQLRQVAEYLTETGPDNLTRPWLLESWEADDAVKTWTLHLRRGIFFNNGDKLTADDVIFNFEQWLDPEIGSSMASLLSYLDKNSLERLDDYTIRLHLNEPQIGVPEHLFHYPAIILPRRFEGDFVKQPWGTGPFTLVE